jgi:hypothetical protein
MQLPSSSVVTRRGVVILGHPGSVYTPLKNLGGNLGEVGLRRSYGSPKSYKDFLF